MRQNKSSTDNKIDIPESLLEAIDGDLSTVVLFVGAGLSQGVIRFDKEVSGEPRVFLDWEGLMGKMIERLKADGLCAADEIEKLEKKKIRKAEGDFLEIAEQCASRMSSSLRGFLARWFDPPQCRSEVHQIIGKTGFGGIITTNFDRVFEKVTKINSDLVCYYPKFPRDVAVLKKKGFLLKIHGCIKESEVNDLVLTEAAYAKLRDHRYKRILQGLFITNTILTVGFSLTDPDFRHILEDLRGDFGKDLGIIYALMKEPETKEEMIQFDTERIVWQRKGVNYICYQEHCQLPAFFDELKRKVAEEKSKKSKSLKTKKRSITNTMEPKSEQGPRIEPTSKRGQSL